MTESCTCWTIAPSGWDAVEHVVNASCPLHATYTAAEVKVLTEKARQEIAEEIAQALEAVPAVVYPEDIFPPDGTSVDCQSAKVMRFAYPAAAALVREIAAREDA